ncbi:Opy2 protein [Colletotrichum higginsianum IMI 349063]|uniref:Opy2 protein n=1 Tax=Colletotrichum higginsianum (strain IMI 349063) TaxID=759273 RepID=A0A1B7Y6X7_COLHI|nr:Opy2 protein [Colletotrichum higginsianum IMI 349063]OBR07757.1 Opy2 protein [Colletotrichum higginsianum IMI 349063]
MAHFDPNFHLRSLEELHAVILPRQNGCLKCEDKAPTCPSNCKSDEFCSFTIPTCNTCAQAICVKDDSSSSTSSSSKPNTGAIVGGVIGGLIVIAIATYLVWRFFIKTKRQSIIQESYIEESNEKTINEKSAGEPRQTNRDSTHTVHSIASTVLTRASNIIQIAYIPGVTNRATPTSPTLLVPPVPPIPMHASNSAASSPSPYEEPHFFVPGELRDSTYSGISGYSDRTSVARTSYAPRSSIAPSIASTIYGKNAVVVAPAQTGMRAKAAVVSVKSMGVGTTGSNTPPVPSVDYEKYAAPSRPKSRDSTFSVGSTFLNNANTATAAPVQRVQVVRVGSGNGPKQVSVGSSKASSTTDEASVPGTPPPPSSSTATRDSAAVTVIEESPAVDQGPFSDPPEPKPAAIRSTHSLSAVIEEATRRAAAGPDRRSQRTSSYERGRSPFGDEHATKD